MGLKIAGIEYEKLNFFGKLFWCIVYPLIAVLVAGFVIVLVIPILIFVWIYMLARLLW